MVFSYNHYTFDLTDIFLNNNISWTNIDDTTTAAGVVRHLTKYTKTQSSYILHIVHNRLRTMVVTSTLNLLLG